MVVHARVIDATHLELEEPIHAQQGDSLVLSLTTNRDVNSDRASWIALSASGLAEAYGEDEPDYSARQGCWAPLEPLPPIDTRVSCETLRTT